MEIGHEKWIVKNGYSRQKESQGHKQKKEEE